MNIKPSLVKKIVYQPLPTQAEKIWDLIERERYRNPDAVIDKALNILLTWESEHPEDTMRIMQSMMPFTPEQEKFMQSTMKEEQRSRYFGKGETEEALEEAERQRQLAISDYDHMRIQNNMEDAKRFVGGIDIKKPEKAIEYDGYPLLFRFYSRFFPVKIVLAVLGNIMFEKNSTKVKFTDLRAAAYDIAEEIAGKLVEAEKIDDTPRNKKISTGLPKKGTDEDDIEKRAHAQKRFKDQYVGKIRKDRDTKKRFVEGAPAALGLIHVFEENDVEYVTFTEKGREFYLMDNPIISGNYRAHALTKQESEYILEKLLPSLKLEHIFIQTAIKTIKKKPKGKITDVLDKEFLKAFRRYASTNKADAKRFGFDVTLSEDKLAKNKITAYRVATMGRLSELRVVDWKINEKGESEFSLIK